MKTLTIEFYEWESVGVVSYYCSNASCVNPTENINPYSACVMVSSRSKQEILAEIQEQFGDVKPTVNGNVYEWKQEG